ncbi:ABC transporter substrate-binding protein [Corynebacterium pacaense]|uniref:taurine ABC transporter substrate-binding protein n=1 Tax=Corynebacterium pacaense TaxID=1816684 RepID=UPI0015C43E57|nr:ABC transporter substrate-binding protein [Corynebacterium pacaense]
MRAKKMTAAAAALAAVGVMLSACVGGPAGSGGAGGSGAQKECPVEVNEDYTGTVRIGYQSGLPNMHVIMAEGQTESCLPNADVSYIRFDTGADMLQAYAAGSIDLAGIGTPPVSRSLSDPSVTPIEVTWVMGSTDRSEGLVVKDPAIRSVADLEGKNIAVAFASTAHYALLKALEENGLEPGRNVNVINMGADATLAAWGGDEIDATWIWDPVFSEVQSSGHVIMTSGDVAELGYPAYTVLSATDSFVDSNADFLRTYNQLLGDAAQRINDDPAGVAAIIAGEMQMDVEDTQRYLELSSTPLAGEQKDLLSTTVGRTLLDTAVFLQQQGIIDTLAADDVYLNAYSADNLPD